MIDIKILRENPEKIKQTCRQKNAEVDVDYLLELDKKVRDTLSEIESLREEQNKVSKEIINLSAEGKNKKIEEMKELKEKIKKMEPRLEASQKEFYKLMLNIPNPVRDDVKIGKDESENEIIKTVGEPTGFDFKPKDYMVIGESLDLIDVERAGKVSGSRFGYLKNEAVLLEFAIVRFVFDNLTDEGFVPVVPPVMIKERAMEAMGYLSHGGEDETYHFAKDGLYLVGTSEHSIGPMHMDEIFREEDLPKRYASFSTCFRREAGSYGKDTRGILRVHQFDKIEMFSFCHPDKSDAEHELLLAMEEKMMQALKLPYQVIKQCSGDLGDPAARKYDIETWIPSEGKYRETHSTSTCTDYQARRLNIRYRDKEGKMQFIHTLNGTAFAIGRILIAILENYQTKEGTVMIPAILQKHMSGIKEIKRAK